MAQTSIGLPVASSTEPPHSHESASTHIGTHTHTGAIFFFVSLLHLSPIRIVVARVFSLAAHIPFIGESIRTSIARPVKLVEWNGVPYAPRHLPSRSPARVALETDAAFCCCAAGVFHAINFCAFVAAHISHVCVCAPFTLRLRFY